MQGGCLGNLAQSMFRWALCSCKDVRGGQLTTDGYDSRTGPYGPGGLAGGVAMNGNFVPTKAADIGGTLWVSATGSGLTIATASSVKQDLRVGGAVTTTAPLAIGHDAYVQGSISGGALLTIKGTLFLTPNATLGANATYGALVREPVTVPAPCDCSKKLNVRPLVVAHGMPAGNDDALVRLAPAVLDGLSGPRRLDLPCGRYYVTRIATTFPLTIIAHGRTALYVDGDVTSTAALTLAPTPGAELDVFIAGNLSASGALSIGSPSYAGSTRVYVAAKTTISSSAASIAGNLHAAGGALTLAAPEVYGAIVAGDFTGSAAQALHYDRAVLSAGNACPSATTCNSCEDCGNQACKGGTCGACASSAECCAPLACTSGRCVASLP